MDLPEPSDWTCAVCAAVHPQPALRCRRCGAALLPFVRLSMAARLLRQANRESEAQALVGVPGLT